MLAVLQALSDDLFNAQPDEVGWGGACPVGRVPAGEIETAVVDQLRAVFRHPEIVAGTWKAVHAHADDMRAGAFN